MSTARLVIPGRPRPGERAGRRGERHFRRPNSERVQAECLAAWAQAGRPRIEGAVALSIIAYYPRPARHFRAGGGLSAEGLRHPYPDATPGDLDNIAKPIKDGLTRRLYADDRRVCDLHLTKLWDDGRGPRTEIRVFALEPPLALEDELAA